MGRQLLRATRTIPRLGWEEITTAANALGSQLGTRVNRKWRLPLSIGNTKRSPCRWVWGDGSEICIVRRCTTRAAWQFYANRTSNLTLTETPNKAICRGQFLTNAMVVAPILTFVTITVKLQVFCPHVGSAVLQGLNPTLYFRGSGPKARGVPYK